MYYKEIIIESLFSLKIKASMSQDYAGEPPVSTQSCSILGRVVLLCCPGRADLDHGPQNMLCLDLNYVFCEYDMESCETGGGGGRKMKL